MELFLQFLVYLIYITVVIGGADYYKILGVSKSSSAADIKRAYRKLSLKYHPDKNPAPDASDKFAEIATAYDVLSDTDKREAYNRGGEDAVKQQEQRQNSGGGGGIDPFNIFESFGFGGMGGRRRDEEQKTPHIEIPIRVTLRQLYLGEVLDVAYVRQVVCPEAQSCQKNNNECQGPGIKVKMQQLAPGFVQQVQVHDASCVARGKAWKSPCKACPNGMTEEEEIQLTVDVQAGMSEGDTVRFDQIADEAVGHVPGDLIFVIKQIADTLFKRDGNDLRASLQISLLESLVGFKRTFQHLDGHEVLIEKNDVTYCSEIYKVIGQGMPIKGSKRFGDLYVTLNINFPRNFTPQQKDLIKKAIA